MNFLKICTLTTLTLAFTMSGAMADKPETYEPNMSVPTCAVVNNGDALSTRTLSDTSSQKDFKYAAKHIEYWYPKSCTDFGFYHNTYYPCLKASTLNKDSQKREDDKYKVIEACVSNFNAWNQANNDAVHQTKADAEAAAEKAKADACNAISGTTSPITAGITANGACACRNKYQAKSGDQTVYDANAKTVPTDKSATSTYTYLMANIRTLDAGQPLVDGNNCCIVMNNGYDCKAQQP